MISSDLNCFWLATDPTVSDGSILNQIPVPEHLKLYTSTMVTITTARLVFFAITRNSSPHISMDTLTRPICYVPTIPITSA